VSDQQPQPTSGEAGTPGTGPAAPEMSAPSEPVTAAAEVEPTGLAPEQEETSPKPDAPKVEPVKMEVPKFEAPRAEVLKAEVPKAEAPKIDAVKPEAPRFPGNVTIMSPGDRVGADAKATPADGSSGKRRFGAMAAVVALATVAGALGGALATAGIGKLMAGDSSAQASAKDGALEATVARIDADIVALKASLEHTAKAGVTQFNKANDRLDKVEKAQAEPAAKLARLSEAVEKLRAAQASMTTAAAAPASAKEKDVTGTIPQQAAAAAAPAPAPAASAKPEVARLPTVDGWVLRDVANGSALIEGRRGMYEVYAGDPVPGLGRVDAIRKQDGRWVVVTSKGLIVAR
jgi:hypothetical protein